MPSLSLFPNFLLHEFYPNGLPLDGGVIYFYESGTLTPKAVYADAQGSVSLGSSVTLDASGTAVIFLGTGAYRIWIKDSTGAQVAPYVDGIVGSSSGGLGNGSFAICKLYSDVRALTSPVDMVYVCGGSAAGDGGQGLFQQIPASILTDDGGIILTANSGTSVYQRIIGSEIDPRWYGVKYHVNIDQTINFNKVTNASVQYHYPVQIIDYIYLTQNISIPSGCVLDFDIYGYFVSSGTVNVTFANGSKFNAVGTVFGNNIQPIFNVANSEYLDLSWFGGNIDYTRWTKVIASTTYNYKLNIDINTNIGGSDLVVPANFAVDFVGGSTVTISSLTNISIDNLVYSGLGQIIKYNNISYIGTISIGTNVHPEWFGFIVGSGTPDNSIAWKASIVSGNLLLQANTVYYVNAVGTYVVGNDLTIIGGYRTFLQNMEIIGVTGLYLYNLILTGTGKLQSSGDSTFSSIQATDSQTLTSIIGATIIGSKMNNIDNIGTCTGTTITNFKGSLSGRISGSSSITLSGTVSIPNNIIISESYIIKNDASDSTKSVLFNLATGVSLTIDNSSIEYNGALIYSTDITASITLNNCRNSTNFSLGLSNGYATISLNSCNCIGNSTATYIDGINQSNLTNIIYAYITEVITASTTWWHGVGSITSDGVSITLGVDTTLDSNVFGANTIRYAGINSNGSGTGDQYLATMFRYCGQVFMEVTYPAGTPPVSTAKLCVAMVQPGYTARLGANIFGQSVPCGLATVNGAKQYILANCWGGQVDFYSSNLTGPWAFNDIWGDVSYTKGSNQLVVGCPRIVIYNAGTGVIPAGTKFKITLIPSSPNDDQYKKFWPHPSLDFTAYGNDFLGGDVQTQGKGVPSGIFGEVGPKFPYIFRHSEGCGLQVAKVRVGRNSAFVTPMDLPITVWPNGTTLNSSYT